jgi:pimeloyl-ACP methyl ester carboxylesterase
MTAHIVSLRPEKSTTERSFVARLSRRTLAAAAPLAPELAAHWAAQRFTTPRQLPQPDGEHAFLASGRPFRVGRIAAWRWGRGPMALLVHGWEGRGAQLLPFVGPLVERGFSVVTFDAPAHGASPGLNANVADFSHTIFAVSERVGAPEVVIAHSLGSVATLLAMRKGLRPGSVVLVAPPSPARSFEAFSDVLALPDAVRARAMQRVESDVGERFSDVEPSALARGLAVPALIVHDADDRVAPWSVGRALADAWPGATLHTTSGLGHHRILRDPSVAALAADFASSRTFRH